MARNDKLLIVGGLGAAAIIGGALYFALGSHGAVVAPPSLYISHTTGGEIQGAYVDQSQPYNFANATIIHVGPAIAYQNYSFKGWFENNQLLTEAAEFDLNVNRANMQIKAVYDSVGSAVPATLTHSSQTVYPEHHLLVWKSGWDKDGFDSFHIGTRADRVDSQVKKAIITYTLTDGSGNPSPLKKIGFYLTAHDPNYVDYTYFAVIQPDGTWKLTDQNFPVIFITDVNGKVDVPVVLMWVPPSPTSDYGQIVKQTLFPVAIDSGLYGATHKAYTVVDNIRLWAGIGFANKWDRYAWKTGTWSDMNSPETPQSRDVKVYATTSSIVATAYSVDNSSALNNQVRVVGSVYLPPNQGLSVYTGDYK